MVEEATVTTRTELALIQKVKKVHPELEGLTATGIIDWALRMTLLEKA